MHLREERALVDVGAWTLDLERHSVNDGVHVLEVALEALGAMPVVELLGSQMAGGLIRKTRQEIQGLCVNAAGGGVFQAEEVCEEAEVEELPVAHQNEQDAVLPSEGGCESALKGSVETGVSKDAEELLQPVRVLEACVEADDFVRLLDHPAR